jgi:hypothetical protein
MMVYLDEGKSMNDSFSQSHGILATARQLSSI